MADIRFATLNLNLLRVFDALYRERSVTRAGLALNVTQPAVSHALAQLRALFDDDLFVRQGTAMLPTALALEIGPRVHAALGEMREAIAPRPFDPATTDRVFTIATGDNVGTVLAPEIVRRVRELAPHARVRIVPLDSDVVRGLDEARIDVAINSFSAIPARLVHDELWSEAPVWMARPGHPALGRAVSADDLAAFDRVVTDLAMSRAGTTPGGVTQWSGTDDPHDLSAAAHRVVVPSFHTAIAIARRADLIVLLPRRLAHGVARDLGLLPIDTDAATADHTLMALWHADHVARPAVAWLRTLILDAAKGDMR